VPVQNETVVRELKKWGMSLPSLGMLVIALMSDPQVPKMNKVVVGGIAAYLMTPVGMFPRRLLGLKRINDVVVKEDRPEIRGMVAKVRHLVRVEEVAPAAARRSSGGETS